MMSVLQARARARMQSNSRHTREAFTADDSRKASRSMFKLFFQRPSQHSLANVPRRTPKSNWTTLIDHSLRAIHTQAVTRSNAFPVPPA
eukprot:1428740-Rhodomonas_salina.2